MRDNLDLFNDYQMEQDERISRLPECSECGEAIQDEEAYYINGEWVCKDCMKDFLRPIEREEFGCSDY